MYGDGYSEQLVARVGRPAPDVMVSKARQETLRWQVKEARERSLQPPDRLHDLYQIYWPSRDVPLTRSRALKPRRKADCYVGVSNFGPQDMADMLKAGRYESNQLPCNLLWRAPSSTFSRSVPRTTSASCPTAR
jgi:aryl-alcohol dehydrogenase-like predicted oxidoreductase